MKNIKIAAVAWGLIYFAMGAIKSFILNSNDTWASVALLFAVFLLPLPVAVMGIWLPRAAGGSLLGCVAINVVAVGAAIAGLPPHPLSDTVHFIAVTVLYNLPHLFFGVIYLRAGSAARDAGSGDDLSAA